MVKPAKGSLSSSAAPSISNSSLKSQHMEGGGLSSSKSAASTSSTAGQRSNLASESTRTGGGRHPHPPTGNNTKLKHKVSAVYPLRQLLYLYKI